VTDIDPHFKKGTDQAVCPYAGGAFIQLEDSSPARSGGPIQLTSVPALTDSRGQSVGEEFEYAKDVRVT